MSASLGYVVAAALRLGPIRFRRVELPLPSPHLALAQLAISVLEWTMAGAVLYVLLPPGSVPFLTLLGAFLASQLLGLASHIPGGVGVFEGLMVLLLKPYIPSTTLLPVLIAYRAVYYLFPLSVAALVLVADELHQRRSQAARLGATFGWLTEQLTPRVLAILHVLVGCRHAGLGRHTRRGGPTQHCSIACFRSASSSCRISPAASLAPASCSFLRASHGDSTPRTF